MPEPTHFIDCEGPESRNGVPSTLPRITPIYGGYDAAVTLVRSKLSLSADIPLEHKHIYGIRKNGANAGDWLYRTAG